MTYSYKHKHSSTTCTIATKTMKPWHHIHTEASTYPLCHNNRTGWHMQHCTGSWTWLLISDVWLLQLGWCLVSSESVEYEKMVKISVFALPLWLATFSFHLISLLQCHFTPFSHFPSLYFAFLPYEKWKEDTKVTRLSGLMFLVSHCTKESLQLTTRRIFNLVLPGLHSSHHSSSHYCLQSACVDKKIRALHQVITVCLCT